MDDLSQWLTADLADDLEAQGAVLALVLGSAVPPAAGLPYLAFDDLRRRVVEVLRKELRIPADQPSSPRGLGRAFLDRARAHVVALPSPLPTLLSVSGTTAIPSAFGKPWSDRLVCSRH